jgi:uncharacterized membrane protein
MIMTVITHVLAFLVGGWTVFMLLHRHQTAAIAAATMLANEVTSVKAELQSMAGKKTGP